MKVAILGATGQIGRCLALAYAGRCELALFSRRPEVASAFAARRNLDLEALPYDALSSHRCDLLINAVGYGSPGRILEADGRILEVTSHYDSLCLALLEQQPETTYVFLSTGAIYGPDYREARKPNPVLAVPLNGKDADSGYRLAKWTAELRHRARSGLRISDIRIFGFLSAEIDFRSGLLMAEVLGALCRKEVLVTRPTDFPRDYVGTRELVRLIDALVECGSPNGAYDLLSTAPTSKFRVLDALERRFGLAYRVEGGRPVAAGLPTRISSQRAAEAVGYRPMRTSLDHVIDVAGSLIGSFEASSSLAAGVSP